MKRYGTVILLALLAGCAMNRGTSSPFLVGPIDTRDVVPMSPPASYRNLWAHVVALADHPPTVAFSSIGWWTLDALQCPPYSPEVCQAHGLFLGPKDVILRTMDADKPCWVMHEMAHVVLGRGDEAHGDPLFAKVRRSCR